MQPATLGCRQSVVQRLAYQGMPKAVASRRAADLVDELKRSGFIEKFDQSLARRLTRGFEADEGEIAADDGSGIENVARLRPGGG